MSGLLPLGAQVACSIPWLGQMSTTLGQIHERGRRSTREQDQSPLAMLSCWVGSSCCQTAAQILLDFSIRSTILKARNCCGRAPPNFPATNCGLKGFARSSWSEEPALFPALAGSSGMVWASGAMCFPSGKFLLAKGAI